MTLLGQQNEPQHEPKHVQLPPPSAQDAALSEQLTRADPDHSEQRSGAEPSVGELAAQLGEQVSRLVRDELALAQAEVKQRAKQVGLGVGMFGAGGLFAFFGACCGVVAAVLGFANVVQAWLAAIIVGALLFVVAGLTVLPGWKGIKAKHPDVPADTVQNVKADVAAVKQAMHR